MEASFYQYLSNNPLEYCPTPRALSVQVEGTEVTINMTDLNEEYPLYNSGNLGEKETLVVIEWLASFHARFWGEEETVPGIWSQGSYWHLDTRLEEYNNMEDDIWKKNAVRLDNLLKGHKDGRDHSPVDTRYI